MLQQEAACQSDNLLVRERGRAGAGERGVEATQNWTAKVFLTSKKEKRFHFSSLFFAHPALSLEICIYSYISQSGLGAQGQLR